MVPKPKARQDFDDPTRGGPLLSARWILALVMIVLGIAWIAYYYTVVRTGPPGTGGEPGGPSATDFMGGLERWNYTIGLGLAFLGLAISAHPSTPLGRGRGVVVGMLGCFLVGLIWICVFYVFNNADGDLNRIPVMNDLGQWNLGVGIGLMAVGFTFATRWE